MKLLENKYFPGGITVLSFITAAVIYGLMPDKMASHWDISGSVNGYMSKTWGLVVMPLISALVLGLFYFIPRGDPMKENIKKFEIHFRRFTGVLFSFFYFIYLLTIAWNLGYRFDMIRLMSPALALLMFTMGLLMENSKPNWTIGIRTPWTLSSPGVWEKTHKLGGKLIKIGSGLTLAGILFPRLAVGLILVPIVSWAIFLTIYSYTEYQKNI